MSLLSAAPRASLRGTSADHRYRVDVLGESEFFLGDDLLPLLVLAIGGALAVGNIGALVRPPRQTKKGELARAPVARSVVMATIGVLSALWAAASLIAG